MSNALICRVDTCVDAADDDGMAEVDRYPPCPECEALPAASDTEAEHFEAFLYVRDPKELARFEIVSTSERHRLSVDDVLAEYSLPENTPCSMLPRGHPHREGYVVRTQCGRTIKLGKVCGRQMIDRFREVERQARKARAYQEFVPKTTERLRSLRTLYDGAAAEQARLWAFREYLGTEARALSQELQNAYRVRLDALEAERIPGIELWDWEQPDVTRCATELRRLELDARGWETERPGVTQQRAVLDRIRGVEERVQESIAWARTASIHATREGMTTACRVLDSEWKETHVSSFDPIVGRATGRRAEVFRRTRDRFRVTSTGLDVLDRPVPIAW